MVKKWLKWLITILTILTILDDDWMTSLGYIARLGWAGLGWAGLRLGHVLLVTRAVVLFWNFANSSIRKQKENKTKTENKNRKQTHKTNTENKRKQNGNKTITKQKIKMKPLRYHAENVENPYKTNGKSLFQECGNANRMQSHLVYSPQLIFLFRFRSCFRFRIDRRFNWIQKK